jgi:hypothetical protein
MGLLPTDKQPVRDVEWTDAAGHRAWLRCAINRPATIGAVLRRRSLAPAGASLPVAEPPRPPAARVEPAAAPPVVRTLSYTTLASWRECGYRFYLTRILGLAEEPVGPALAGRRGLEAGVVDPGVTSSAAGAAGLEARMRGTLVHALLEQEGPATERVAGVADAFGVTLSEAEEADVARLADAFAGSALAKRIAKARTVHREYGFTVTLGRTLLTGVVDVLARERGGAQLVVDYKTDAVEPATDLDVYVQERYGVQRRVYALAALRGGAARVEIAHAFLERPHEPVVERFEAADADRLEAKLLADAAPMLAGEYPVAQEPHRELCATCPGRRALCSYTDELTLRERPT